MAFFETTNKKEIFWNSDRSKRFSERSEKCSLDDSLALGAADTRRRDKRECANGVVDKSVCTRVETVSICSPKTLLPRLGLRATRLHSGTPCQLWNILIK